jgi:hypothetical protein
MSEDSLTKARAVLEEIRDRPETIYECPKKVPGCWVGMTIPPRKNYPRCPHGHGRMRPVAA